MSDLPGHTGLPPMPMTWDGTRHPFLRMSLHVPRVPEAAVCSILKSI